LADIRRHGATVKYLGDDGCFVTVRSEDVAPAVASRNADFGWIISLSSRRISGSRFPKYAPIWLELHHIVEHEIVVSEPMHPHGEGVAHVGDGTARDGSPEHVGSVEIHVALWIRQDLENEVRRCFDSA
jgi:hypothetical protein